MQYASQLLKTYYLDVIARIRVIRNRCRQLMSKDYPSSAPLRLSRTIEQIVEFIHLELKSSWDYYHSTSDLTSADVEVALEKFHNCNSFLQELGAHLRYIDGALTEKQPWSIITAVEKFAEQIIPTTDVMLRPQWKYNYAVVNADIQAYYRNNLVELKEYTTDEDFEAIFGELKGHFYTISFPSMERKNIFLHCLVGHELGHIITNPYISDELVNKFLASITPRITTILSEEYPLFKDVASNVQSQLDRSTNMLKRGLSEMLADHVGAKLFGPAFLFSLFEIAIQNDFDHMPSDENNYYPPWRYRLREVRDILSSGGQRFLPLGKEHFQKLLVEEVNSRYRLIQEIVDQRSDIEMIQQDRIADLVYGYIQEYYRSILNETSNLEALLGNLVISPELLYSELRILIDRLRAGIPPNAVELSLAQRRCATIPEILNASWFFKIAYNESLFDDEDQSEESTLRDRNILNRLTLKAVEFSNVQREYEETLQNSKQPLFQPESGSSLETGGALGKAEIIDLMQVKNIERRLVITPLVDPDESIGSCSVDVRLGGEFIIMKKQTFPVLDIRDVTELQQRMLQYHQKIRKDYRDPFVLHPRQLIIGSTLEYLSIPPGVMCYVSGKSSWGRMGLIIATAVKIDTGFKGCVTLEIINEGEVPIVLYPGIPIAQIVLHRTSASGRYEGRFVNPTGPQFPDFSENHEKWKFWYHKRERSAQHGRRGHIP